MKKSIVIKSIFAVFFTIIIICLAGCGKKNSPSDLLHPTNLRCEQLTDPLGIDVLTPRLSWISESQQRAQKQTAYQILAAGSLENLNANKGDLWDSKKIETDQSINVVYAGKPLTSGNSCYWKVKVWDKAGKESDWSQPAHWSTGLLGESDWKAKWIGLDKAVGKDNPKTEFTRLSARMLRKEFEMSKTIKKATVYVCGLGLFELYVNGEKIGDQVLAPALSEYNKRAYYMTFDVTQKIQQGKNAIGVILGNGRFFAPRGGIPISTTNYGFPKLILQMNIEYSDGSTESVVSDPSWKLTADGPIIANNEYDGEEYDATKEIPGWNKVGFDDSKWMNVEPVKPCAPKLVAQMIEPIKIMETIKPISVKEITPGVFIFDMGQNLVGWVSLKVQGQKGKAVTMRFAETLLPDGNLYLTNLRSSKVTDIYTLKGEGAEIFEPRFIYHGFRFVEVKGFPGNPDLSAIEGKVVYDNLQTTGTFSTSNETINTVYKNAYWGIRGNYRSIPTDCPQRDERQGWLGDRATGSKGESFVFGNATLYAKWLQDIDDAQREDGCIPDVAPTYWKIYTNDVTWPAAYLIITNMLYEQYGDTEPIRKHYGSFRKWVGYMKDKYLQNGVLVIDTFGDWCMPPENPLIIFSKDPKRRTGSEILSTTYYYHMLALMQRFAGILNKADDAKEYQQLSETIYKAYNEKYFNNELKQYGNNTATANLLSLAYGLVPEDSKAGVFNNIMNTTMGNFHGHISTGLIGAQWINRILTQYGRADIAYRLVTNTDYPSWGYMAKSGATTIWELWNGNTADPAMNSGNHVMLLGDLVIWFYENLAGIKTDPENPAFRKIIMKPIIAGDLKSVKASYQSSYGNIGSEWDISSGEFIWNITIPANAVAVIYVPAEKENDVEEDDYSASKAEGVKFLRMENGRAVFEIGSGNYKFSSEHFAIQKPGTECVESPVISTKDTSAISPMIVTMDCSTKGAEIRFTRDGSEPTETSELYSSPVSILKLTQLTAKAFKKDLQPSYKTSVTIDIYNPAVNGLNYKYYEGKWTLLPDFKKLTPKTKGKAIDFDLDKIQHRRDYFGLAFQGYLDIEKAGDYKLFLRTDDGGKLIIDGKTLILNDALLGVTEKSCNVTLTAGKHSIELDYFNKDGDRGLDLEYSAVGIQQQKIPISRLFLER